MTQVTGPYPPSQPGRERVPLVVVLWVALAVRLAGLNHESFSMDEVTDLEIARLPIRQIVLLPDGFPPLYHLLLKGWLLVWDTPLAARWLSALFGLVTVYAVYRLALDSIGRPGAVAAGALTAISPLHVWFAQESRAYALALPLAALLLWRFRHALTTNSWRDWLIYAGVAVAAVCSHYFLAIMVAVQAIWALARLVGSDRERRPALAAYGLLALSALPVLMLLRIDLAYQSGTGDGAIGLGELLYIPYVFLLGFSVGPSLRELHEMGLREAVVAALPWVVALTIFLSALGLSWRRRPAPDAEVIGYLLLTCLAPILVTMVASASFGLKYKISYVSWASIPFLVLLGDAIAKSWDGRWRRAAIAGYLVLALLALGSRHLVDRYRTEDLRSVAAYLEAHSSREAPVFVVPSYMATPLEFYLGGEWPVRTLSDSPGALGTLTDLAEAAGSVPAWLVYTRPFHGDPAGDIRARLTSGGSIRLSATFAGVDLYRFDPSSRDRIGS